MELVLPLPYTQGEWLAWGGAVLTVLFGLVTMLAPRVSLRALALPAPETPAAYAGPRSLFGGFYAGIGISAILFAQPLIYLTLGLAWGFAALGRLVSMVSDGGNARLNWLGLGLTLLLAALPLAFSLGFVP